MLTCDIDRIQIGKNTQIRLFTDHRNWIQSPFSAQAPAFVAPAGIAIVSQVILDDHTALLTVNPLSANTLITLVDAMNQEAITLKCWDTPQFQNAGELGVSDDVDAPNESHNPIDDGYWDQSTIGGFSGGGLI